MDKLGSRINSVRSDLTKAERVIVEYITKNEFTDIIYLSITEMAARIGVGDATLLRFCRKLGFSGYQEFKIFLAQEMAFDKNIENVNYAEQIAEEMMSTLKSTLDLVNLDTVERAAERIIRAEKVCVFGGGSSGVTAQEMRSKLVRSGLHLIAETDPHFQSMIASTLTERDVGVFISVSGSNKDLLSVAKIAKGNAVPCIMITNYLRSPLSAFADDILYTVSKEDPMNGSSLVSKVSQLFTINVLCHAINAKLGETSEDNFRRTAMAVADKLV